MDPPAIVLKLHALNRELLEALRHAERLVARNTDVSERRVALSELRCRLIAHAAVEGQLLLPLLRAQLGATMDLAQLGEQHDALVREIVELASGDCGPDELARFARELRIHLALERREVATAVRGPGRSALAAVPAWHAREVYERSGGPTEVWAEKWLG